MEIELNFKYAHGEYDTQTMELVCIPGRGKIFSRNEIDADLCIKNGGLNACVAQIHMGNVESANALCQEIVRRFNEFPQELKR